MALMSRLSDFLQRMFDDSEPTDISEAEGAEGFLMTTTEVAPPVLPSLARASDAPPAPAGEARQSRAQTLPPVPAPVEIDAPVLSLPGEARAAAPVEPDEPQDPGEPPDVSLDEPSAGDATADLDEPADPNEVDPAPAEGDAAPLAISTVAASDPEAGEVKTESVDDMMAMFRESSTTSDFTDLTKDMEDVPAQELLTEALALRDMLVGATAAPDNAA